MAEQLSLFGSPEPEQAPVKHARTVEQAKHAPAPEPIAAYASVVLDIPTRALSEPFAYGIPQSFDNEAQIGSTVLVHFGNRAAAGYIVDIVSELCELKGNNTLDPARIKLIEAILSKPLFSVEAARIARWMSREYVATLSECLRLFLPPGGSPRVVKGDDGAWTVERPAVKPFQNRWVMLTPEALTIRRPRLRFVSVSSSRRSSADRSRRATSTCSTTVCRRPLRRSKNVVSSWWRSAEPGVAAASRLRCPRQAARRRSRSRTPAASTRAD